MVKASELAWVVEKLSDRATRTHCTLLGLLLEGLFTGHDPSRWLGQEVSKNIAVRVGSDQEVSETSRVGSCRVGSGRVGSGQDVF